MHCARIIIILNKAKSLLGRLKFIFLPT